MSETNIEIHIYMARFVVQFLYNSFSSYNSHAESVWYLHLVKIKDYEVRSTFPSMFQQ